MHLTSRDSKVSVSPQEVVSASKRSQRGLFSSFKKPQDPTFRPTYNHVPDASACRVYGTVAVKKVTGGCLSTFADAQYLF
jgi:hypothetical protein